MKTKAEIASEDYFGKFNCAQSVMLAFAEDCGLDEKTALRIGASFGGGCQYGSLCGAVAGGAAIIGSKYGNDEQDLEKYARNRELVRELLVEFDDTHGSINCSVLLGMDMSHPDGRDKAKALGLFDTKCKEYVRSVAAILEDMGF